MGENNNQKKIEIEIRMEFPNIAAPTEKCTVLRVHRKRSKATSRTPRSAPNTWEYTAQNVSLNSRIDKITKEGEQLSRLSSSKSQGQQ